MLHLLQNQEAFFNFTLLNVHEHPENAQKPWQAQQHEPQRRLLGVHSLPLGIIALQRASLKVLKQNVYLTQFAGPEKEPEEIESITLKCSTTVTGVIHIWVI
jgi:hypothetical protein